MNLLTLTTPPDMTAQKPYERLPIAITMGDAAGIGPEIIVKAFTTAAKDTADCFVVGDVATMRRAAAVVAGRGVPLPVAVLKDSHEVLQCPPRCVPVLQIESGAMLDTEPVPLAS